MFDIDKWQEIFSAISKNKLRTILTGFSVFWGIFILIILLGSGRGLQNGIMSQFSGVSNAIYIWGGQTSIEYNGMNVGRDINVQVSDIDLIRKNIPQAQNIAARRGLWGERVNYREEFASLRIDCIDYEYLFNEGIKPLSGRLLNKLDRDDTRKVAIIGRRACEKLCKKNNPIGEYIRINGVPFLVVGTFDCNNDRQTDRIYIPLNVAQRVFMPDTRVGTICFTVNTISAEESVAITEKAKRLLAAKYNTSPDDTRAFGSYNTQPDFKQTQVMFSGISLFVTIIGIFTIIAGIVGVSNIMMIVVKERTKEIGIRKAIGASPWSIISLIIQESIVITATAGYLGLLAGVGVLELASNIIPADGFFRNPSVNFWTAIAAAAFIVVAGAVAGYIPAKRAASIKPIVALRDE